MGVAQNVLGMAAAQLRLVRVAMGLIPREVFSADAWPVAMFDWLIAEKDVGEISRVWWRRYGWLAESPLEDEVAQHVDHSLSPGMRRRSTPTSGRHSRGRFLWPRSI